MWGFSSAGRVVDWYPVFAQGRRSLRDFEMKDEEMDEVAYFRKKRVG